MISKDTADKIDTCFREIALCRKLLDTGRADEMSARLLSIYILIRTDDITKLWCLSFSKDSIEHVLAEVAKNKYNGGFRNVRDKIGAHFQSADKANRADIFESSRLFHSFDQKDINTLVDELKAARDLLDGIDHTYDDIPNIQDLSEIERLLDELHDGGKAYLTTSSIELFGPNRGGLISCTKEQRKAQNLRSIELMVQYAYTLAQGRYVEPKVERMFKRLLVCVIYSYHDNLFTRTDVPAKAPQSEDGFDRMYMTLLSRHDDKSKLENIIDDFDNMYHTSQFFRRHRCVRDRACGHLDEKSGMAEIDKMLDGFSTDELYSQYTNMLNLFNYLCQNIRCLQFLTIEPRSLLPTARFETIPGSKDFYGRDTQDCEPPVTMSPDEILRSLRKNDSDRELAEALLAERLRSHNDDLFYPMIEAITRRLEQMKEVQDDFCPIFNALHNAKGGSPERLQTSLLIILHNDNINNVIKLYITREIASLARKVPDYDLWSILNSWMKSECYPLQAFGFIAGLHFLMSDSPLNPIVKTLPLGVDKSFTTMFDSVTDPVRKLGIILLLNQHWHFSTEYQFVRKKETEYDRWLKESLCKSITEYAAYIHNQNKEELNLWKKIIGVR